MPRNLEEATLHTVQPTGSTPIEYAIVLPSPSIREPVTSAYLRFLLWRPRFWQIHYDGSMPFFGMLDWEDDLIWVAFVIGIGGALTYPIQYAIAVAVSLIVSPLKLVGVIRWKIVVRTFRGDRVEVVRGLRTARERVGELRATIAAT